MATLIAVRGRAGTQFAITCHQVRLDGKLPDVYVGIASGHSVLSVRGNAILVRETARCGGGCTGGDGLRPGHLAPDAALEESRLQDRDRFSRVGNRASAQMCRINGTRVRGRIDWAAGVGRRGADVSSCGRCACCFVAICLSGLRVGRGLQSLAEEARAARRGERRLGPRVLPGENLPASQFGEGPDAS